MTISRAPDAPKGRSSEALRNPLTKGARSHPLGTGLGAAAGGIVGAGAAGAAGAATGTVVGGPIGTAAGLAVGAVVGGLAGRAVAEKMDPAVEDPAKAAP